MRVCRAALRVCAVLLNSQQTHAHTQSSKRKGARCFFVYIDTILITKSISKHEKGSVCSAAGPVVPRHGWSDVVHSK